MYSFSHKYFTPAQFAFGVLSPFICICMVVLVFLITLLCVSLFY